jgi:hypothetical protein
VVGYGTKGIVAIMVMLYMSYFWIPLYIERSKLSRGDTANGRTINR